MNRIILTIALVLPILIYAQTPNDTLAAKNQSQFSDHILNINGVWIESNFKALYDSLGSMAKISQSRVNHKYGTVPIGLRFNLTEINDNEMNIGYGVLHNHEFSPEISGYAVQGEDTLYAQGKFTCLLNQKDSAGYFEIPDLIPSYRLSAKNLMSILYGPDTTLHIIRLATADVPEIRLSYERLDYKFELSDYQYPNPGSLFLRSEMLVGNYTLLDSLDYKISSSFKILESGQMIGFTDWETKKIELSSDVFCGGPAKFDKVLIYNPNNLRGPDVQLFLYEQDADKTIRFYCYKITEDQYGESDLEKDRLCYTLIPTTQISK